MKEELELLVEGLYTQTQNIQMLQSKKQLLLDSLLTDEQKRMIDEIGAEFDPVLMEMQANLKNMEGVIRSKVVELEESVITEHVKAVYAGGKTSWDSKKLEGYAAVNPEVLQFRSIGNPYVRIQVDNGTD